jgi:hypothetical protein
MTIAQRMTSLASRVGTDATFRNANGDEFTAKTGTSKVAPDEFASDQLQVVRNPIALILPNSPAVTFPPELSQGMTIEFDYLGTLYTLLKSQPYVLAGAVQYWRVVGGV